MTELSTIRLGRQQKGVALFLTLTILLILTVLGISSVQTASMQERMSRNYRDVNIAFQGAEAATAEAEEFLEGMANIGVFPDDGAGCAAGLCNSIDGTARWTGLNWDEGDANIIETTITKDELGAAMEPMYMIEYVAKVTIEQDTLNIGNVGQGGSSGRAYVFRITSRGTGGTEASKAMISSLYGRQF